MLREGQSECFRCGTCCRKGGPALHGPDLELLTSGRIPRRDLITIRKGELAYNPAADGLVPTSCELVKLRGVGREWSCCYYDQASRGCLIYGHRPLACRTLKCWQPEESLALVERDCLGRLDIVADDAPLRPWIVEHEQACPCPDLPVLGQAMAAGDLSALAELQRLSDQDLALRGRAVQELGLDLNLELFAFGRPLFQVVAGIGVRSVNEARGVRLALANR